MRFAGPNQPEHAGFLNIIQLILNFELARCGCRGYIDGFLAGGIIGLPPVLNFGSDEIKSQVVPEVLAGKKFICLAISEAFAGSDVSGLQTTAVRDGDHWVISGTKKYAPCRDLQRPRLRLDPVLDGLRMARLPTTSLLHVGQRLAPRIHLPPPTLIQFREGTPLSSFREAKMSRQAQSRQPTPPPLEPLS